MQELRANTQVIVRIGSFMDATDGVTPETGVTLGSADQAELIKHGSTTVVSIAAATWAAITGMDGWYALTLTTSHTDTEGMLEVVVQDSSLCLPVVARFMVLSEAAWDSKYAPKDDGFMDVNIKTIGRSDTQETETDNLESACANYSATRGLSGTALPAAAADAAGGLVISDAGSLDLDTLLGRLDADVTSRMATFTLPTNFSSLGINGSGHVSRVTLVDTTTANTDMRGTDSALPASSAPTNFSDLSITASDGRVDVGSIEGSDPTDQIRDAVVDDATRIDATALNAAAAAVGSDGSGLTEAGGTGDHLTGVPWNSAWDAEVQSEVNDGLVALGLDHLFSTAVVGADVVDNSYAAKLVSSSATADYDDFDNTSDSLQAIRDNQSGGAGGSTVNVSTETTHIESD